jgi:hypothetical protein
MLTCVERSAVRATENIIVEDWWLVGGEERRATSMDN